MRDEELNRLEELFSPVIEENRDILKSIILYGSAVRKERVEGSDIDVLIIVDDTDRQEISEDKLNKMKNQIKDIEESGQHKDMDLHIQPPRLLSNWTKLLIRGKPWAVTAIRHSETIYDPGNLQSTLQKIIKNTDPKSKNRRSRKLVQDASKEIEDVEDLKKSSLEEIINHTYKSGKLFLDFKENPPVSKYDLADKIEEKDFNPRLDVESYRKALNAQEKIERGDKKPKFTDLEMHAHTGIEFIKNVRKNLEKDVENTKEQIIIQTFAEIKETCIELLNYLEADFQEEEAIEKFKEKVIDTGILGEEYWDLISDIKSLRSDSKNIDDYSKPMYDPLIRLRDFETAVNNVMNNKFYESFEMSEKSKEAHLTPINEFEAEMLNQFDEIKGVYVLSINNLLESEDATVVLLVDTEDQDLVKQIKEYADGKEKEIGAEHGFNIHTKVEKLTKYWKNIQNGEDKLIYEIHTGLISYDPHGLLKSIQQLVERGEISNTSENIKSEIGSLTVKIALPLQKVKEKALQKYYDAAIKLGQAILLQKNIAPPVQKKVPDVLKDQALETQISQEDIETIEKIIKTNKKNEYGEMDKLPSEELEKYREDLNRIEKKTEKIIENKNQ